MTIRELFSLALRMTQVIGSGSNLRKKVSVSLLLEVARSIRDGGGTKVKRRGQGKALE